MRICGNTKNELYQKFPLIEKAPHADLTYKIIGAAMAVHRKLGPGYGEKIYHKNLEQEFQQRLGLSAEGVSKPIAFESPKRVEVYDERLTALDNSHVAQVITYLTATKSPIGLLLNFGERSLVYRRILPPKKVTQHHINYQWLFVPDKLKKQSITPPES